MSDFEDALKQGFEAHRDATRNKKEIFSVFEAMSLAVSKQTDQKVFIEAARVEKTSVLNPLASVLERTVEFVTNQLPEPVPPDALFAVRRGAEGGRRAQLCRLKLGPFGYPIEVTMPGRFMEAADRESLQRLLVELLQHPDTAGKIADVARLRGWDPSRTTAEASTWLDSPSEAERTKGYRIIGDALQRQEELDQALRKRLLTTALDASATYVERGQCVRLLHSAHAIGRDVCARLADVWFCEPTLSTSFSSILSGVFDRRERLAPLLERLQQVEVPANPEAPHTSDVASPGYRLNNAFSSILVALRHDAQSPLDQVLRVQIGAVCSRFSSVPQLAALLRELEPFVGPVKPVVPASDGSVGDDAAGIDRPTVEALKAILALDPRPWRTLAEGSPDQLAELHFPISLRPVVAELERNIGAFGFETDAVERGVIRESAAAAGLEIIVLTIKAGAAVVGLNAALKAANELPDNVRRLRDKLKPHLLRAAELSPAVQLDAVHRWLDGTYGPKRWKYDPDQVEAKQFADVMVFHLTEENTGTAHLLAVKADIIQQIPLDWLPARSARGS